MLLSIHDVSPRHEAAVDALVEHLAPAAGNRLAMLVVPNFWGSARIVPGSPFATRLRRWSESGIEMFLHGLRHLDDTPHQSLAARWKASRMTAGEGEFLGLTRDEALARIREGSALLEDVLGAPAAGFVAPAWLYGAGTLRAMAELRIPIAEDHWHVWSPASGAVLARSPVITWASRTRGRMRSSLLVAALARSLPLPRIMRVGVHPGDVRVPAILASIRRTVERICTSHRASAYRDLFQDAACAS